MPWVDVTQYVFGQKVTAAVWVDMAKDLQFLERVGHQTFASPVNSTATTEGTATAVVSLGSINYEAVPHMLWFYTPRLDGVASNTTRLGLFDDTTVVHGRAGSIFGVGQMPVSIWVPINPTAAAHIYNIKVWCGSATTVTVQAGAGGADGYGPGFISIYRVPT